MTELRWSEGFVELGNGTVQRVPKLQFRCKDNSFWSNWTEWQDVPSDYQLSERRDCEIAMTDLEITRACAEARGYDEFSEYVDAEGRALIYLERDAGIGTRVYDPLHDDAQMAGLVKEFDLNLWKDKATQKWWSLAGDEKGSMGSGYILNRAVCTCVAQMWLAKQEAK